MSAPPPPLLPSANSLPKRRRTRLILLIVLSVLAMVVLLLNLAKGAYGLYRSASAAVDRFHLHLNAGDYDGISAEASESFRRSGNHTEWIEYFAKTHQNLGNSGKLSTIAFYTYRKYGRAWVYEVVDTQFAHGEAHERFVWTLEQGQLRLYWYQIEARNLH